MQRQQRDTRRGSSDYRCGQRSATPDDGRGHSRYYSSDRYPYRESSSDPSSPKDNYRAPKHERDRYDRRDPYTGSGSSERHARGYSPSPRDYSQRGRSPERREDRRSSERSPSPGHVRFHSPSHINKVDYKQLTMRANCQLLTWPRPIQTVMLHLLT